MNAGCFGSETKDILDSVEIYTSNFEKNNKKKEINLEYRSSNIQNDQIITKAKFDIKSGNSKKYKRKMKYIKEKDYYLSQ